MSLQRYVFILIATMVLLVAAMQLLFTHLIREQVAEEISSRSQAVTDLALNAITQQQPTRFSARGVEETPTQGVVIRIENAPSVTVDLGDGVQFVTGDKSKIARITPLNEVVSHAMPVAGINLHRVGSAFGVSINSPDQSQSVQHFVQFDDNNSRVSIYFNTLMWVTAGLALVGLILAFWLARHFSKPLQQLADGFDSVAQGNLGRQVEVTGVGEVRETMSHFNTMSDRLRTMQALEQQLQQRNHLAELGEVARGLAHSLRNPLNTIGLAIEQMQQPGLSDAERAGLVKQTHDKIAVMDKYIRHLLNLSDAQIQRNKPVELLPVVQDLLLEVTFGHKHTITCHVPEDCRLIGAEIELRSMLQVLLSNALEASPADSEIALQMIPLTNGIKVVVTDNGPGCDPQILGDVFKPHSSTRPEGAGMGLFITQRLAELHYQGSLTLHNLATGGCEATLILHNASLEDA